MGVSELAAAALKPAPIESGDRGTITHQLPPLENRAKGGKTPFIRSHGDGLVAWQLLDNESVERAKSENKLIFLHVGYQACHCKPPSPFHSKPFDCFYADPFKSVALCVSNPSQTPNAPQY